MKINIDSKIENWKNKLLDLGKRNKLLNFKQTKRSTVQINNPDCILLWKSLVENEKPFEFPYYDEINEDSNIKSKNNVETNQNVKDLQKTLKNLRDKTKTAYEEQGINILFLSFGLLKWTESKNSDYIYNSPLILVPVNLSVRSIVSPYILSLHEDEIVVNPTLKYKMENDFGIIFPDFNIELGVVDYFEKIKKIVHLKNWDVSFDVNLSLLSFLKINMYNDLLKHKEKIKKHSIIRTIIGDISSCEKIPEELIDFDFDKQLKPSQVFQVLDADSSQQDAILYAKKGISFVLQGPPGTGKSQTITNIISECLAEGKKVLFVSEKMAALEVVHKRLTNAQLDDFCLILHGYKAQKRKVLDQLEKVIQMSEKKVKLINDIDLKLYLLENLKQRLNDYSNQLFTIISPLNKSIYNVNGILAHLVTYDDIVFPINDIEKITKEQFNQQLHFLQQFSETIGNQSDDFSTNPWYNSNIKLVTNELRHDILANLTTLTSKVRMIKDNFNQICTELKLNSNNSYSSLKKLIPILELVKESPLIPYEWTESADLNSFCFEIDKYEHLKLKYDLLTENLINIFEDTLFKENFGESINSNRFLKTKDIEYLINLIQEKMVEFPYSNWEKSDMKYGTLFKGAKDISLKINDLKNLIISQYETKIFEVDYIEISNRFKTEYNSIFKKFKKSYRKDKKIIQLNLKTKVKKVSDEMIMDILSKVRTYYEFKFWFKENEIELKFFFGQLINEEKTDFELIERRIEFFHTLNKSTSILHNLLEITTQFDHSELDLKNRYSFLYNGLQTDWNDIRESIKWGIIFKEKILMHKFNEEFVRSVCTIKDHKALCSQHLINVKQMLRDIDYEFDWFLSLFESNEEFLLLDLDSLITKIEKCKNNLVLLEEWIDFRNAKENCQKVGLLDYITKIEQLSISKNNIIPCYKKRFYRLWLDAVLPNYPSILNFRKRNHEKIIDEFSELDKLHLKISRAVVKEKLINSLPEMNRFTNGYDEIGILKREISKQRKIMPVRKLFSEIPNLLLTLKPCLMMSPLSVSLFLEADTYMFDTVIFDEASQVCTENAIGAISRGKQVIIAGDSKQLPPTNFFNSSTSDSDFDDDNENDEEYNAFESILDEANLLPERTLRWHYRSRHEHLIAFSNAKIYRNNLITFPSNKENSIDNGVEYIYVHDGFYDRGGKSGNVPEAKKVAELVFDHFRKQPNRSIGVIAFGEVQQQAIDTQIRILRIENQQFEKFFNEEIEEPFFVKNLENVQGDERDTIIFSIGYAKDSNGVFKMNFGPLSNIGGERRLNVAITRAKFNIKLIGSIMPNEIDLERVKTEGPKLLKYYLDFAINGIGSLQRVITESDTVWNDSPFEEAVYNFLDRKGYRITTQVGCSGYRIDMAVKHPNINGIYVLGIECDGATYHSARTARDRDRLRQEVLEKMGWKIYRIWSTDWIKDPISEGEKLLQAVDKAISSFEIMDNYEKDIPLKTKSEFLIEQDFKVNLEQENYQYQFEKRIDTSFNDLPRNIYGYLELTDCITLLIKNEYPIHYELLCQKIAPLYGNQKATIKIRREVDFALIKMMGNYHRKDDFLYPSKDSEIIVKMPNNRNINHISAEEIATAMMIILSSSYGPTKEGLFSETRKVYGFKSLGQNINSKLDEAFNYLIQKRKIEIVDNKIRIRK
jgi:superfamily I DNA and/or RNA helicase/very-short-patch-repair endonuclease/ABC-type iron transport system FetAB ATPase subunit